MIRSFCRMALYAVMLCSACSDAGDCSFPSTNLVILIDISLSPEQSYFSAWKSAAKEEIDRFQAGTVYIMPIKSEIPGPKDCFYRTIKRKYPPPVFGNDDSMESAKAELKRFIDELQQTQHQTDIRSALIYALNILDHNTSSTSNSITVYSDFLQTTRFRSNLSTGYRNVIVTMWFGAPVERKDKTVIELFEHAKEEWEGKLRNMGIDEATMKILPPQISRQP